MTIRLLTFILLLFLINTNASSQRQFEGEIEYEITYLDISEDMQAIASLLPKKVIFIAKGTSYKMVNKIEGKSDQTQIMHNHDGSGFLLLDFLGHKIALQNDAASVRKSNANYFTSQVEFLEETKEILNQNCKKANVFSSSDTTTVYFSSKYISPEYKYVNLKGLPLEYISSARGLVIQAKAIKITKRKVDDFEFERPYEYKEMNKEELEELFRM